MTTVAEPWVGCELTAIGTFVHVLVTRAELLEPARAVVTAGLQELDLACSRFRTDSELWRLGHPGPQPVSSVLAEAVESALRVAVLTEGLVDPTLGGALVALGYDRTLSALPGDGPAGLRPTARPGRWRDVTVSWTPDGPLLDVPGDVLLDLGASAKAWCADQLARRVADLGTGVLVNLGGDLAVAGPVPPGGWPVRIGDRPDGPGVQTVSLSTGALATSSTTARTWRRGGEVLHHVLDPWTGLPAASPWRSVSVCAPTCLEANALSTATVVLGTDGADWLEASGQPACLLGEGGRVLRLNGWPHP